MIRVHPSSQIEYAEYYVRIKDIVKCIKIDEIYKIHVKDYDVSYGTVCYIIHCSENERMKRIICGTDNPITELVDELQNHPSIGILPKLSSMEFQ